MTKKKIIILIILLIFTTCINLIDALPTTDCSSDPNCANIKWWRTYRCDTYQCKGDTRLLECAKCEPPAQ